MCMQLMPQCSTETWTKGFSFPLQTFPEPHPPTKTETETAAAATATAALIDRLPSTDHQAAKQTYPRSFCDHHPERQLTVCHCCSCCRRRCSSFCWSPSSGSDGNKVVVRHHFAFSVISTPTGFTVSCCSCSCSSISSNSSAGRDQVNMGSVRATRFIVVVVDCIGNAQI